MRNEIMLLRRIKYSYDNPTTLLNSLVGNDKMPGVIDMLLLPTNTPLENVNGKWRAIRKNEDGEKEYYGGVIEESLKSAKKKW